jgi:hypothetical protein
MEKRIEEIVHAFGEAMEQIVFNSNGKAKTMDLAKAWLRARLQELVREMQAEFQGSDPTKIVKEGLSQSSKENMPRLGGSMPGSELTSS